MEEMKDESRYIPADIRRKVRKRCGFGCVFCGIPLYEYEHIEDWAKVRKHVAKDITLLCDKHHKQVTNGWISKDAVRKQNLTPYNLGKESVTPLDLHFSGNQIEVKIGAGEFIHNINTSNLLRALCIDNTSIVEARFEDGHILFNINMFDKQNTLVFSVKDNELTHSTTLWDVSLVGTEITIRQGLGDIFLCIQFIQPNKLIIKRGFIFHNGVEFFINEKYSYVLNNHNYLGSLKSRNFSSCGIVLGTQTPEERAFIRLPDIERTIINRPQEIITMKDRVKKFHDEFNI